MARNIVPYASISQALASAEDRRAWLSRVLEEHTERPPRFTVSEPLPDRSESESSFFDETSSEVFGQYSRLRWQLSSDAFLLLERVSDAVINLVGREIANAAFPRLSIKLTRLKRARLVRNLYPWRVTIGAFEKDQLTEKLPAFAKWLGIGVDIEDPPATTPFNMCKVGYDGRQGLVGGIVDFNTRYAVTCRHVVSSECQSISQIMRQSNGQPASAISSAPDAVLLDASTPCFSCPGSDREVVAAAPASWLEMCMIRRNTILKTHISASRRPKGVVKAIVSVTNIGQRIYRFPQIEIIPRMSAYFFGWIRTPLLTNRFSAPGESGVWVREVHSGMWLGMIVGGDDLCSTYALEASALLDYMRQLVGGGRSTGIALTWPLNPRNRSWIR